MSSLVKPTRSGPLRYSYVEWRPENSTFEGIFSGTIDVALYDMFQGQLFQITLNESPVRNVRPAGQQDAIDVRLKCRQFLGL